jgi:hypothetical protein
VDGQEIKSGCLQYRKTEGFMKIYKLGDRNEWQNRLPEEVRQRKINRQKARHDKLLVRFVAYRIGNGQIVEAR